MPLHHRIHSISWIYISTKSFKICFVFVLQIPGRLYPIEVRYQPPKVEVHESPLKWFVGYIISLAIINDIL